MTGTTQIGEKIYSNESMSEKAVGIIEDIRIIDVKLMDYSISTNIAKIAKNLFIEELTKEIPNMEEVPNHD